MKQLCAIESIALNNPNAMVRVLSLNATFKQKFLENYSNIIFEVFTIEDVFNETPFFNWWINRKKEITNGPHYIAHISDALRLVLMYKYGGFYSDLDTITIRNLGELFYFPAVGTGNATHEYLGNGILNFPRNHKLINDTINDFIQYYSPQCWSCNGPNLIKKKIGQSCSNVTKNIFKDLVLSKEKIYKQDFIFFR